MCHDSLPGQMGHHGALTNAVGAVAAGAVAAGAVDAGADDAGANATEANGSTTQSTNLGALMPRLLE